MLAAALALAPSFVPLAPQGTHFPAPLTESSSKSLADTALADLDGDGRKDLVTAGSSVGGGYGVEVAFAQASGNFAPPSLYALSQTPVRVEIADLDADGALDLVVATASGYSTFRGLGGGSFAAEVAHPLVFDVTSMVVADLDLDGRLDLVFGTPVHARVLYGTGGGSFSSPTAVWTGVPTNDVNVIDVDGDAKPDLVARTGGGTDAHISVRRSLDGHAFVNPPVLTALPENPSGLALDDLNGDGRPDAVMFLDPLPALLSDVAVFEGLGDGTFAFVQSFPVGLLYARTRVQFGDLDGDGVREAIVPISDYYHQNEASLSVVEALPGGGYAQWNRAWQIGTCEGLEVGDLDGDGRDDVAYCAFANYEPLQLASLRSRPGGEISPWADIDAGARVFVVGTGDFDDDGGRDVAVGCTDAVRVYHREPQDQYALMQTIPSSSLVRALLVHDLTGDGREDLLELADTDDGTDAVRLHVGRANGTFETTHPADGAPYPLAAAIGDLDGDGEDDFVTSSALPVIEIHRHVSGASFELLAPIALPAFAGQIELGDVDEDGDLDLVVRLSPGVASLLRNLGSGAFAPPRPIRAVFGAFELIDLDGDGHLDFVFVSEDELLWRRGRGNGTFQVPRSLLHASSEYFRFTIADVDADGSLDVLARGYFDPLLQFFRGQPGAAFDPPETTLGGSSLVLACDDMDGDGRLDLVQARGWGNAEHVLILHQGHP